MASNKMLLSLVGLCVLSLSMVPVQFASSIESLECLVLNSQLCIVRFVLDQQRCGVDQKEIQCLKNLLGYCEIDDSTGMEQVRKLEQVVKDVCQQGSELQLAFLKHKDCLFGEKLVLKTNECNQNITKDLENLRKTRNTGTDHKEVFKITCKYRDEVRKCTSTNTKKMCEEGAESFQRKFNDLFYNLEDILCNENSATFMQF